MDVKSVEKERGESGVEKKERTGPQEEVEKERTKDDDEEEKNRAENDMDGARDEGKGEERSKSNEGSTGIEEGTSGSGNTFLGGKEGENVDDSNYVTSDAEGAGGGGGGGDGGGGEKGGSKEIGDDDFISLERQKIFRNQLNEV